jgi:hypothetical protein
MKKYSNCVKLETSIELKIIILIFQINDKKKFQEIRFDFFEQFFEKTFNDSNIYENLK